MMRDNKLCKFFLYKLFFLIFIICIFSACSDNQNEIFVSPEGNDSNPGTFDKPLATAERAIEVVRELKNSGDSIQGSIIVTFRKGVYQINSTLEFGPEDRGIKNSPVVYQNYKDEEVIFSGGRIIQPEDFKPLTDKKVLDIIIDDKAKEQIKTVNLKELGIENYGKFRQHGFSIAIKPSPMELFIDSEPQIVARYPNQRKLPVSEVIKDCSKAIDEDFSADPGIIGYDYERPHLWHNPRDIWLWGYFAAGFADDNLGVKSIDTTQKAIHLEHAHMFGMVKTDTTQEWGAKIVGYYAYNILEEIDMPGEYYIDREKGILYYYPKEDFKNANIVVSTMSAPLLAIENTSDIIFKNITIEYGKGMGVYIEGGKNVKFAGCTIRNFGTVGAMFGKGVTGADFPIHEFTGYLKSRTVGNLKAHHYANSDFENNAGKNHGFVSCDFYNLGTGAIVLSGGDRKTLTPAGNYIENCNIHDYNRWNKTYCSGIKLYGVGNIIRHNHIFNAPHQAIEIFGNEHLIEFNHINNVVKEVHDMGSVYMGRNPSERGNIVRNNYFANIGVDGFKNCAIHIDDGASDMLVEGNIFYKASRSDFADILLNGGNDNIIRNNIFIKGSHTLWIEDPRLAGIPEKKFNYRYPKTGLWGRRMLEDIDMNSEVWKEKYPDFKAFNEDGGPIFLQDNEFYNNVIVDEPLIVSKHNLDTAVFVRCENNYITKQDPGFEDMEKENFNLKNSSVIYDKIPGFKPIPFDSIGIIKDTYRK